MSEEYHKCTPKEINPLAFIRNKMKCPVCNEKIDINKKFLYKLKDRLVENIAGAQKEIETGKFAVSEEWAKAVRDEETHLLIRTTYTILLLEIADDCKRRLSFGG